MLLVWRHKVEVEGEPVLYLCLVKGTALTTRPDLWHQASGVLLFSLMVILDVSSVH